MPLSVAGSPVFRVEAGTAGTCERGDGGATAGRGPSWPATDYRRPSYHLHLTEGPRPVEKWGSPARPRPGGAALVDGVAVVVRTAEKSKVTVRRCRPMPR